MAAAASQVMDIPGYSWYFVQYVADTVDHNVQSTRYV